MKGTAARDDPKAVEIVTTKIGEIRDGSRNRPAYETAVALGARAALLTPWGFDGLCTDLRNRAGPAHADTIERGLQDGAALGCAHAPVRDRPPPPKRKDDAGHRDARRAIAESSPAADTIATVYLERERLVRLPEGAHVRFHPALPDYAARGRTRPVHPAIVCPFRSPRTGAEVDAIGVIYLTPDGKKVGKLARGSRSGTGSAVVLGDLAEGETIILAEGLETALSGANATGWPALATWGVGFASVDLPEHIRTVVVLADHRAREIADKQIEALRARCNEVRVVVVRTPDPTLDDANDLHRSAGLDAVRAMIDRAVLDAETPATAQRPAAPSWREPLAKRKSQPNIRAFLEWAGVELRHDAFAHRDEVRIDGAWRELGDADANRLWLEADACGLDTAETYFRAVIGNEARKTEVHPVRDYLARLRWDGTPRIDGWLIRYVGAADTPLNRAIGRLWLMAAVRRVRSPGVKFDQVLVLEGPQGVGKSSIFAALGGAWFSDGLEVGADAQRVLEQTTNVWIAELAELAGMSRREAEAVKTFVSRQSDRARPAYARSPVDRARQFVLAGTTNADTYLTDPTGNRRFWPVRVGTIDLAALQADRDQIWAEAAALEATGASICMDSTLWADAAVEQEARVTVDPWEDTLERFLGRREGRISVEALWDLLDIPGERRNPSLNQRLGLIMRRLGWRPTRQRHPSFRRGVRCYANSETVTNWLDELVQRAR